MKKTHTVRTFLAGFLTALFLTAMIPSALALAGKTVTIFPGVSIYMDDQKLNPTDANGNPVEVFIYNGTTYLPVRAIGEALGQVVQWDGSTHSVYVGKHNGDRPAAYLCQMDYFSSNGSWERGQITTDNLGRDHSYSLRCSNGNYAYITYKLNGLYTRLTAVYYQQYAYRDSDTSEPTTLVISGDGRELWHGSVGGGIDPINIDIDVTGVLELKIEYPGYNWGEHTAIGDVGLWT